jgi:hypothetical protein
MLVSLWVHEDGNSSTFSDYMFKISSVQYLWGWVGFLFLFARETPSIAKVRGWDLLRYVSLIPWELYLFSRQSLTWLPVYQNQSAESYLCWCNGGQLKEESFMTFNTAGVWCFYGFFVRVMQGSDTMVIFSINQRNAAVCLSVSTWYAAKQNR